MTKTMWITVAVFIAIDIIMTIVDQLYMDQTYTFSLAHWVVGIIINIIAVFLNVNILNIVKERAHSLSVFGYFWRVTIASTLAYFFALAFMLATGLKFEIPSIQNTLVASALWYLFIPIFMWTIFSSNRKAQFMWVSQIFRGVS